MNIKRPEITPEMFITGPYSLCPRCDTNDFGIVIMGKSRGYCEQQCRRCFYKAGFDLPEIKKKIIYLDQFAISNMMKAINIDHRSNGNPALSIWKEIFNKIDTLLHYQLVICPYSTLHENESVLANKTITQDYQALKKMYKHLAQGKHFPHIEEIERVQYYNGFKKFLGNPADLIDWEIGDYMDDFHNWSDNIYISIESGYIERIMDDIYVDKNNMHDAIIDVYDNEWIKIKKSYNALYNLEIRAHGRSLYNGYARGLKNLNKVYNGVVEINEAMGSILGKENDRFLLFYDLLTRIGITKKIKQIENIATFLLVSDLSSIQFINIESILWAGIAELSYKKNISRKQINAGMVNDISAISHYLPYCDAMMVDGVIDNLLGHKPVKERLIQYNIEIFSGKTSKLGDFLIYLDSIYNSMTTEHKTTVERVYGKSFNPFINLYDKKK